jgi:autotransporter-associated beta strand protein
MKNPEFLSLTCGRTLLTAAITALLLGNFVQAGNNYDGGGANGLWTNPLNWDSNVVIVPPAEAKFGGTLQLAAVNDFAATTAFNGITFNAGAGAFVLSGNSVTLGSGVTNNSTNTQTVNLDLILSANRDVNATTASSNIVIGGVVSGAFRLQAIGLGTVTLNGTTANTYTGQTSASGNGTFIVDLSNIASHTNLITPSAATSQLNTGNGNAPASGTFILRGASSGTSSQTLNGLQLTNGAAGTFIVDANGGGGTNLNLGVNINRAAPTATQGGGTATFDISSPGATLTGTTLGLTAGTQTAGQAVRGYALVKDATGIGFATNVGGALVRYTGATALTPGGTGLTTTAANNYSLAAGGTTTTLAGGQTVQTLSIDSTGTAGTLNLGAGVTTLGALGVLTTGNAATTIQGGQLGAANTEVILSAAGTGGVTVASTISSGTGHFTKTGSDTVTLTGANTYSGTTSVLAGTLKAGNATALSATSAVVLSNSSGVSLDLTASSASVGSLGGGGAVGGGVLLGSNTLTLGGSNAATGNNNTYGGVISGTGGITKVGTGPQTLSGTNTYTGATSISGGGSLILTSSGTINNTSGVFVDTGSTFNVSAKGATAYSVKNLSGTGTVTGVLNVTTQLATGTAGTVGTLTFTGNTSLGTAATHLVDINGGTSSADLANVTGNLSIGTGTILDLVQLGTYTTGSKYTIASYTGTLTGTYAGLANGSQFNDAGGTWQITYNDTAAGLNGGTGPSYITITAIPEPSALLLGSLSLLGLAARRTRRNN